MNVPRGSGSPPGAVERAARILARLAHRFADREAILWRGGFDEERWSGLERELLAELGAVSTSPAALAEFGRAFVEARLELTRSSLAPSGLPNGTAPSPPTVAAPTLQPFAVQVPAGPAAAIHASPIHASPGQPSGDDPISVTPHSGDEGVPTLPKGGLAPTHSERFRSTAQLGTPHDLGNPDVGARAPAEVEIRPDPSGVPRSRDRIDEPVTDEDDLSVTMHSNGRARGSAPPTK